MFRIETSKENIEEKDLAKKAGLLFDLVSRALYTSFYNLEEKND